MITRKRAKRTTVSKPKSTSKKRTTQKSTKKPLLKKIEKTPKKVPKKAPVFGIDSIFNQLAELKKEKDAIKKIEDGLKEAIKSSGFNDNSITTSRGFTFKRVERPKFEVHKAGAVKALGKDTFIKYAKITATDIKKAIGDAGLQDLLDKGTVKQKKSTIYYALQKNND